MAALLPSAHRSKPKWWWPYFLLVVVVLFLLWKLAPGTAIGLLDRLSPFHIGTPWISGTVVDAVTGNPVPRMDVCLLVTYDRSSFSHRPTIEVLRSETTRTDESGRFFFERWDTQRDLFDSWDGYGIAVTDPAAQWKDVCGKEIYLLGAGTLSGHPDVFQTETYFQDLSDSAAKSPPPYFPVAMVEDLNDPHPLPYGLRVSFGHFPDGTLVRKIGNPSKLKIALVPLLRDANECQLAQDPDSVNLCRQMNQSLIADALRTSWKISPQGPSPSQ
jgi:hypothetical protein